MIKKVAINPPKIKIINLKLQPNLNLKSKI